MCDIAESVIKIKHLSSDRPGVEFDQSDRYEPWD
jgi:hypothetical protein